MALHFRPEWCSVTLAGIGDAVITTHTQGRVTYLNPVAESLTGWTQDDAAGKSLETVFRIVNRKTGETLNHLSVRALQEGVSVGLPHHTLLIAKDGAERQIGPIDNNVAPIRNVQGELAGVVLIFRDITERRKIERALDNALAYADDIIATLREPFLVLDGELRVKTANRSFYDSFHVSKEETENCFVYDLGNGRWDFPGLRMLLDQVLSANQSIHNFEVEHLFPGSRSKDPAA